MSNTIRRKIPSGTKVTPFWLPDLRDSSSSSVTPTHSLSEDDKRRSREIGYQEGLQMAQAEIDREREAMSREHQELSSRLSDAVNALEQARAELEKQDAISMRDAERKAVELAYELCETILEREVSKDGAILESLERGVALLASREPSVVRCHEDDVETLRGHLPSGSVRIIPDDSVSRGGCIIEAGAARVDARWESALERVRESLGLPKS